MLYVQGCMKHTIYTGIVAMIKIDDNPANCDRRAYCISCHNRRGTSATAAVVVKRSRKSDQPALLFILRKLSVGGGPGSLHPGMLGAFCVAVPQAPAGE